MVLCFDNLGNSFDKDVRYIAASVGIHPTQGESFSGNKNLVHMRHYKGMWHPLAILHILHWILCRECVLINIAQIGSIWVTGPKINPFWTFCCCCSGGLGELLQSKTNQPHFYSAWWLRYFSNCCNTALVQLTAWGFQWPQCKWWGCHSRCNINLSLSTNPHLHSQLWFPDPLFPPHQVATLLTCRSVLIVTITTTYINGPTLLLVALPGSAI